MLIVGFIFAAYVNLPILGISLAGFAIAYYYFTMNKNVSTVVSSTVAGAEEFGDDFDE